MWHGQEARRFVSLDNDRAMQPYIEVEVQKALDKVWEGERREYFMVVG